MTLSVEEQIQQILQGKRTQFAPPIQIQASQLSATSALEVQLPHVCTTLWIPPTIVVNGQIVAQPANLIVGVQLNLASAPVLPWGLLGNCIASFTGPVSRIYVTLLSATPAAITFLGARGIGIGYSGGLTAAGTPSSSPSFGSGTPSS